MKDNPKIVAKIATGRLTQEKKDHITSLVGLNTRLKIDWASFPLDLLYDDPSYRNVAGFTETLVNTTDNLGQDLLYTGNAFADTDAEKRLDTKVSDSIALCLKVVRQVFYLNCFGFFISDFNTENFAYKSGSNRTIQMWDTHSFGYNNFFSGYHANDVRASREYDLSNKLDAIEYSIEMLYVFVFGILSLGDKPINERTGKNKYDNPEYLQLYRKQLIPENLMNLLQDCFHGKREYSVEALLSELSRTLNEYRENPALNKSYRQLRKELFPKKGKTAEGQVNDAKIKNEKEESRPQESSTNSSKKKNESKREKTGVIISKIQRSLTLTKKEAKKGCKKNIKYAGKSYEVIIPSKTNNGDRITINISKRVICIVTVTVQNGSDNMETVKHIAPYVLAVLILGLLVRNIYYEYICIPNDTLPNCIGMNIEDKKFETVLSNLESKGISYTVESIQGSTMDDYGDVLTQDHIEEKYDDIDGTVSFEYSGDVDVVGWQMEKAIDEYEDAGWETDYYYQDSEEYLADIVIDQTVYDSDKSVTLCIGRSSNESKDNEALVEETASSDDDFMIPESNRVYLSESDIKDLSETDTQWAINEIYARNGRTFVETPFAMYLEKCSWYNPTYSGEEFKDEWLNEYERENLKILSNHRKIVKKTPPKETTTNTDDIQSNGIATYGEDAAYHKGIYDNHNGDFIIPGSDERKISESEIEDFSVLQTQWAINEIFARHGRDFKGKPYSIYFRKCDWYEPLYSSQEFKKEWFNGYETENIKLLTEHRKAIKRKK